MPCKVLEKMNLYLALSRIHKAGFPLKIVEQQSSIKGTFGSSTTLDKNIFSEAQQLLISQWEMTKYTVGTNDENSDDTYTCTMIDWQIPTLVWSRWS